MKPLSRSFSSHDGEIVWITLTNAQGASVTLSNLGAGIVEIRVPDALGELENVVLGYENPLDYLNDGPCAGKIPGRYANRIARGLFSIDGKQYHLAINNGPNALHGGPTGFQNRIWDVEILDNLSVRFHRVSPDGEEGYPANLDVVATYRWDDDNRLSLSLEAHADAPTVVNLTNHAYFNLGGALSGSVLDHSLHLDADFWVPTDETLIPLPGAPAPVADTPMDFRSPKPLGRDINTDFPALRFGKGYDNCWIANGKAGSLRRVASLLHPSNGRTLEVWTTQPAVQIYTGNWLNGCPKGANGHCFNDYDGVAIECQNIPDAPNRTDFPSPLVTPENPYNQSIEFRFSTK